MSGAKLDGGVEMMAAQAVAKEQFTFRDVERLCERHLARRSLTGIGYRLVRYERSESQHFRCAYSWVSDYLLERIDFDRAFRQLSRRSQKVLIAWYGMERWTQQQIADWLGVTPRTVRRWRVNAIEELRGIMNG